MARFEVTLSDGEKILVERPSGGMRELLSELQSGEFVLVMEIRGGGTAAAAQEVIVASSQVTLVRAIEGDSRQSTTFRPKR